MPPKFKIGDRVSVYGVAGTIKAVHPRVSSMAPTVYDVQGDDGAVYPGMIEHELDYIMVGYDELRSRLSEAVELLQQINRRGKHALSPEFFERVRQTVANGHGGSGVDLPITGRDRNRQY